MQAMLKILNSKFQIPGKCNQRMQWEENGKKTRIYFVFIEI